MLLIIGACDKKDTAPIVPNYPPDVYANITGAMNFRFAGKAQIFNETDNLYGLQIIASNKDTNGVVAWLGIFVYFKDRLEKTGEFAFSSNKDSANVDNSFGYVQVGKDDSKKLYISYKGVLKISQITSKGITGTFSFTGKEQNSGSDLFINDGQFNIDF